MGGISVLIFFTAVLLLLLVIILCILLIRWRISYSVLSCYGIKGRSPVLYYGNAKEIKTLGLIEFIEVHLQRYGGIFGADDDDEEAEHEVDDPYKRRLTDMEITRASMSFLAAGHETTNNALGFTSYLLALNPDKQEKLFQEISEFYSDKPDASLYEAAQTLLYTDMVIQESLRLYPPAPIVDRHTAKTIDINGQVFPKDSVIVIPIREIHHSPDIWPDPFTFKPERFTKEEKEKRHQMAHMPFGWGPRSCIGMRLALMEAKMALIAILKEYKFVEAPDTEKPIKTSFGITMIPTNGVYLTVERR